MIIIHLLHNTHTHAQAFMNSYIIMIGIEYWYNFTLTYNAKRYNNFVLNAPWASSSIFDHRRQYQWICVEFPILAPIDIAHYYRWRGPYTDIIISVLPSSPVFSGIHINICQQQQQQQPNIHMLMYGRHRQTSFDWPLNRDDKWR